MTLSCFIAAGYVFDVWRLITNLNLEEKSLQQPFCPQISQQKWDIDKSLTFMPFLICSCQGAARLRIDKQIKWNFDRDQCCSGVSRSAALDRRERIVFFFFSKKVTNNALGPATPDHLSLVRTLQPPIQTRFTIFLHMEACACDLGFLLCVTFKLFPPQPWNKQLQSSFTMSALMCDPLSKRDCYLWFEAWWRSFRVMHGTRRLVCRCCSALIYSQQSIFVEISF